MAHIDVTMDVDIDTIDDEDILKHMVITDSSL